MASSTIDASARPPTGLAGLLRVAAALSLATTRAEVVRAMLDTAVPAMKAHAGVIAMITEDRCRLELVGARGATGSTVEHLASTPLDAEIPFARVARSGVALWIGSVARADRAEGDASSAASRALACVPLVAQGRSIGAFGLQFSTAQRFPLARRRMIEMLACHAADALERARLHEGQLAARAEAERVRRAADLERVDLLAKERHARAEAERANAMKDEFLARVTHELRTPLHALLMWADLLRTASGADREMAIGAIQQTARAQSRLIGDLMDISRAQGGKLRIVLGPVDLGAVVTGAIATLAHDAGARRIRVVVTECAQTKSVRGDAARLQQAVVNLLANAIRYSPVGSQVDVRLWREGSDSLISVADAGVGISPTLLPHVFTPYRQGEASAGAGHGGLGLGLAIVRELIERHGGVVTAESPGEGRGATFTVRLPTRRAGRARLEHRSG